MTILSLVVYSFILQNYRRRGKQSFCSCSCGSCGSCGLAVCVYPCGSCRVQAIAKRERAGTSPALSPPPTGLVVRFQLPNMIPVFGISGHPARTNAISTHSKGFRLGVTYARCDFVLGTDKDAVAVLHLVKSFLQLSMFAGVLHGRVNIFALDNFVFIRHGLTPSTLELRAFPRPSQNL